MRLTAYEMIQMAEKLLSGAKEQVLEEMGSPPFPQLTVLSEIQDSLHNYIIANEADLREAGKELG